MTNEDVAPTNDPTPDALPGETPAQLRKRKATERREAKAAKADATPTPPAAPKVEPKPTTVRAGTKEAKRAAAARLALGLTAAAVSVVNDADGDAIAQGAADLAAALAKVAETSPKLAKVLDIMTVSGAWSDVALAISPIALAIAANHGLFGLGSTPAPPPTEAAPVDYGQFGNGNPAPWPDGMTYDNNTDPVPIWMQPFTVRPDVAASPV